MGEQEEGLFFLIYRSCFLSALEADATSGVKRIDAAEFVTRCQGYDDERQTDEQTMWFPLSYYFQLKRFSF